MTDLISISAAARELGLAPSTLSRQIASGRIRNHDGKVRLNEVIEDRKANVAYPVGIAAGRPSIASVEESGDCPEDDWPVGDAPYTTITEVPLTRGLVRQLAELIGSENPGDFAEVGQDLVHIGSDILVQTIEAQRGARRRTGDEL